MALLIAPVTEYAIIVDPNDNIAVVKKETTPGLELFLPDGREVRVAAAVVPGQRFATGDIPASEFVLQYGQPIGTSLGIAAVTAHLRNGVSTTCVSGWVHSSMNTN